MNGYALNGWKKLVTLNGIIDEAGQLSLTYVAERPTRVVGFVVTSPHRPEVDIQSVMVRGEEQLVRPIVAEMFVQNVGLVLDLPTLAIAQAMTLKFAGPRGCGVEVELWGETR
jgi:hypothetical protein